MDYLREPANHEEYFLDDALDSSFGKYGISIADVCVPHLSSFQVVNNQLILAEIPFHWR